MPYILLADGGSDGSGRRRPERMTTTNPTNPTRNEPGPGGGGGDGIGSTGDNGNTGDNVNTAAASGETQFRVLVQNVFDYAIFMLDPDGRVTTWNEGAARVKGYTADEIVGTHFSIFFTPEDQAAGKPEVERSMGEAQGRYEAEGWRVRKDGRRIWVNEVLTAVRDAGDGRLVGFTKIARDLTERKAMADALSDSEERLRLLVDNIRDYAVFVIDPGGHVVSWNAGGQRVFGFAAPEIVGRHHSILFTPEDRAAAEDEKELATALAEGRASDDRWQLRKGQERFFASGVTTPIRDASGVLRGFAKVCRDLTDQRVVAEQREQLLEQEKLARLEAERAMTMRDEFLAVVSHELRTPLTAILLWSRLLESGAVDAEDRAAAVSTIRQSAEAQRQLIEDLLDISRITSGKMRLAVRPADVGAVIRAAAEAVRPMAEARGVELVLTLDDRAGTVRCDPDRLQQVAWNLLNNAVKFTGRGGQVAVLLERIDGVLRIVVADTGQGIAPGFLPHVFDLFRQAESPLTRVHGGLGLGLSICKRLVEMHGGSIRADSPGEGRGATFTIELPLADVRAAAPAGRGPDEPAVPAGATPFAPSPVLRGVRVLFAEDEHHTRSVVQWLLEQCGATVTAVASAAEAFEAYRKAASALPPGGAGGEAGAEPPPPPFDVLISDLAMPGQDGFELIRRIRAAEAEQGGDGGGGGRAALPALALTAQARASDRHRAADAGFRAHVAKPVEPASLVAAVAELAGR